MSNTVLRLAQVGFNWDDPSLKNFIYTEQTAGYSVRLQASGSCTTNTTDGNGSVAITHNFGYAPWAEVFVTTKAGDYIAIPATWLGASSSRGAGDYLTEQFNFYVTSTQIICTVNAGYTVPQFGENYIAQSYTFNVILHMERIDL